MIPRLLTLALLVLLAGPLPRLLAAEATAPTAPTATPENPETPAADPKPAPPPTVVKLDENRFRIGDIEFNSATRAIRFPAAVNMCDGQLEFALVHENGKVHESLLSTKINPSHLNFVFKLLRFSASGELFPLIDDEGHPTGLYPQVDPKIRAAARVHVRLHWKDGQTEKSASINEWIRDARTDAPMEPGPWVYSGSVIDSGQFIAEATGDIIAIYLSPAAMFNYPGKDNDNDDVWVPQPKIVPPKATPVTVEISPWKP